MYFKVNPKGQLDWEGYTTIFIVILHKRVSVAGTSTYVFTNASKQGTVSSQFTAIGHSTVNQMTEFDLHLEIGLTCLSPSMRLIGEEASRLHLDANELGHVRPGICSGGKNHEGSKLRTHLPRVP